jgi:hypothetical protein
VTVPTSEGAARKPIDGQLSALNRALRTDPRAARARIRDEFDRLAAGGIELPYTGDRLPLTPGLLPGSWQTQLDVGCRAMFDGIEAIFRHAFDSNVDRLADYLLFAPAERDLLRVNTGGYDWAATARPDFMVGPTGPLIIESNITTSMGLLESALLGDILLGIPACARAVAGGGWTRQNPAVALADAVAATTRGDHSPLVVLADWAKDQEDWLFLYRYLVSLLAERDVDALPVLVEDLDVRGDGVFVGGRRVSVVYRFFTTIRLRDPEVACQHEPLLHAVRDGTVRMFGSYGHKLFTPKLFLALLSDERYASCLPRVTADAVQAVIPWTRILAEDVTLFRGERIDLPEFSRSHRAELVLKPNLGYGGAGVCVGAEVTQGVWEQRLAESLAADEHWLVQEAVAAPTAELAFLDGDEVRLDTAKVDYGVFMIGREIAGAARRNSTAATGPVLTNLSLGGGLAPVFFAPGL